MLRLNDLLGKTVTLVRPKTLLKQQNRLVGLDWRIVEIDHSRKVLTLRSIPNWRKTTCQVDMFLRFLREGSIIVD